jgi:hypothetical protein
MLYYRGGGGDAQKCHRSLQAVERHSAPPLALIMLATTMQIINVQTIRLVLNPSLTHLSNLSQKMLQSLFDLS